MSEASEVTTTVDQEGVSPSQAKFIPGPVGTGPTGPEIPPAVEDYLRFKLYPSDALIPFAEAFMDVQIAALALGAKTLKELGETEIADALLAKLRSMFTVPAETKSDPDPAAVTDSSDASV